MSAIRAQRLLLWNRLAEARRIFMFWRLRQGMESLGQTCRTRCYRRQSAVSRRAHLWREVEPRRTWHWAVPQLEPSQFHRRLWIMCAMWLTWETMLGFCIASRTFFARREIRIARVAANRRRVSMQAGEQAER